MNKTLKKIVNDFYCCKKCSDRNYCEFWKGENMAFDCGECTTEEFADGVHETLLYLQKIPWDKAMDTIVTYKANENE